MGLLYYEWQYQNGGMGKRAYSTLLGQFYLDVYRDIGDDLYNANHPPLQEPNPSPVPADDWARVVTVYPFAKITGGIDTAPFISVPETRYKVGSYSYLVGKEVITNEDGTVTTYPFYSEPRYLYYERQVLEPFRFVILKQYLEGIPDEIVYDEPPGAGTPSNFYYLTSFYFGSNAFQNGYGFNMNLYEGFYLDVVFYYTWGTLQLPIDPDRPTIIFPF